MHLANAVGPNWPLISSLFGGCIAGVTVKLLDAFFNRRTKIADRKKIAEKFVSEHLDPVLKAADEFVGKLLALARQDFRSLHGVVANYKNFNSHEDLRSLIYLMAKFWASADKFRNEGISMSIVDDERGKQFLGFLNCLTSSQIRIVDRMSIQAISEVVQSRDVGPPNVISYIDFCNLVERNIDVQRWLAPLFGVLNRIQHTAVRQKVLKYGVIVHALIDTLDPHYRVSSEKPSYPERLSNKTRRDLVHRVFPIYLQSVERANWAKFT